MGKLVMPDGLYISVSQLKTFLRCPRQYELKYVRGVAPAFLPVSFAFDSAFHETAALMYSELKNSGSLPAKDLLAGTFRDSWARASSGSVPFQADEDDPVDLGTVTDKGARLRHLRACTNLRCRFLRSRRAGLGCRSRENGEVTVTVSASPSLRPEAPATRISGPVATALGARPRTGATSGEGQREGRCEEGAGKSTGPSEGAPPRAPGGLSPPPGRSFAVYPVPCTLPAHSGSRAKGDGPPVHHEGPVVIAFGDGGADRDRTDDL
jgi:hypothetical protein